MRTDMRVWVWVCGSANGPGVGRAMPYLSHAAAASCGEPSARSARGYSPLISDMQRDRRARIHSTVDDALIGGLPNTGIATSPCRAAICRIPARTSRAPSDALLGRSSPIGLAGWRFAGRGKRGQRSAPPPSPGALAPPSPVRLRGLLAGDRGPGGQSGRAAAIGFDRVK